MHRRSHPRPGTAAPVLALAAILGVGAQGARATVIGNLTFDPANATTTAAIGGGGYVTDQGTALFSGASPDWSVSPSLGTYFQVPTFQSGYNPSAPALGPAGSPASLGRHNGLPNVRDLVLLGWGAGKGLANGTGNDLAVFESATSEAFAIRVHSTAGAGSWTAWHYTPYWQDSPRPDSSIANDTTPTLFDLSAMGLAEGVVINALEIANLLEEDTLGAATDAIGIHAQVYFGGSNVSGQDYEPLRYSSSQSAFVPFESGKFDPDIQYVVGLHAIQQSGVPAGVSSLATGQGSSPQRLPPTLPVPAPGALPLLAIGLLALWGRRRSAGTHRGAACRRA